MNTNIAKRLSALLLGLALMGTDAAARSEETVTLSDVHLCCKGCTGAVEQAAANVPGVVCKANQDETNVVLTAASHELIQHAMDEIAKAGLSGAPDSDAVKFTPAKTPDGKVARLEVTHIHNCCGGCTDAIKGAVESVEGVASNNAKSKVSTFVVEGDFVAADVVKALMDAGFYAEVKQE